jgi:hypothetical protein
MRRLVAAPNALTRGARSLFLAYVCSARTLSFAPLKPVLRSELKARFWATRVAYICLNR